MDTDNELPVAVLGVLDMDGVKGFSIVLPDHALRMSEI